jgi:hypothetical protein
MNGIDVAQSTCSEQVRVLAREGGKAIIVSHSAVVGIRAWPVRKWSVSTLRPYSEYPGVLMHYILPRKKVLGDYIEICPDNIQYVTVELPDGTVLYDSRADVPCNMTEWNKTYRESAQGRAGSITSAG